MSSNIVSLDWDNTLILWETDVFIAYENDFVFNSKLLDELKLYKKAGAIFHITTFRGKNFKFHDKKNSELPKHFFGDIIEQFLPKIEKEYGIKIEKVHYTNGEPKSKILNAIGASIHFDDSSTVCCDLVMNSKVLPIFVDGGEKNVSLEKFIKERKVLRWEF